MNILLVSHGAALGGSPISLLNIAEHKINQTIQYHFTFGERGPIVERARYLSNSVHIVTHDRRLFGIRSILKFLKLILLHRIDIVHLNTFTSYYKYPAIAAKLARRKVIWFVRENPEDKRCVRLKRYANFLTDRIVTVSYDTAKHLSYVNKGLIETIHNGVDTDHFSPNNDQSALDISNRPFILNISSLEKRKGVYDLIVAFAGSNVRKTHNLILIGEDRSKEKTYLKLLLETIKNLNIADHVIFVGPQQDVRPYMKASTIITLVSYWEGLSRVLIEALAMGKPILASRNGGNKEVVQNGVNGLLVDAGNTDDISHAIDQIITTSNLEEMGKKSRLLALSNFNVRETARSIEQLYLSIG